MTFTRTAARTMPVAQPVHRAPGQRGSAQPEVHGDDQCPGYGEDDRPAVPSRCSSSFVSPWARVIGRVSVVVVNRGRWWPLSGHRKVVASAVAGEAFGDELLDPP